MTDKNNMTGSDHKARWGGVLEFPFISNIVRQCVDGGRIGKLSGIISPYHFSEMLDVCCGPSEYNRLAKGGYTGFDNSHSYIAYAQKKYSHCRYVHGDAMAMPFEDNSFDAVLFACASHHFADEEFIKILHEMRRTSRRYIIFDDAIKSDNQGFISSFMYGLDRGSKYRTYDQIKAILRKVEGMKFILEKTYRSFPGIYLHAVFVLEVTK